MPYRFVAQAALDYCCGGGGVQGRISVALMIWEVDRYSYYPLLITATDSFKWAAVNCFGCIVINGEIGISNMGDNLIYW